MERKEIEKRCTQKADALLNKYLLVIVGVLIAFAILLSTLLINKTSVVRRLENELKRGNVTSFIDFNKELEEQNG